MNRWPVVIDCNDSDLRNRLGAVLSGSGLRLDEPPLPPVAGLVVVHDVGLDVLASRVAAHRSRGSYRRLAILAALPGLAAPELRRLIDAGADACLPLPCDDELFAARAASLLRRLEPPAGPHPSDG
ncbi:MAG: hypothetical protein KGL53_05835 [Elusimicrobia bacterium]|nr:hypothetical protein [Elusimicrobiota bacterium]